FAPEQVMAFLNVNSRLLAAENKTFFERRAVVHVLAYVVDPYLGLTVVERATVGRHGAPAHLKTGAKDDALFIGNNGQFPLHAHNLQGRHHLRRRQPCARLACQNGPHLFAFLSQARKPVAVGQPLFKLLKRSKLSAVNALSPFRAHRRLTSARARLGHRSRRRTNSAVATSCSSCRASPVMVAFQRRPALSHSRDSVTRKTSSAYVP